MKDKDLTTLYKETNEDIKECRLNKAISKLKKSFSSINSHELLSKLSKIEETYAYMIHYLLEGFQDSGRESLLASLREKLFSLNDQYLRIVQNRENEDYYYEILRVNKFNNYSIKDLLNKYGKVASELTLAEAVGNNTYDLRKNREDLLEKLFNTLLTSFDNPSDIEDLKNYILSGYSDDLVISQSLSAVTLSLLMFYDQVKVNFLLDLYDSNKDIKVSSKSLLGLLLTLMTYPDRISIDSAIKSRLILMNDSDKTYNEIKQMLKALVGTCDTVRIMKKMKDEVLPELMKFRTDIFQAFKDGNFDNSSFLGNPEWEEMLENSGLNEKLRKLNDMHLAGSDMMMASIAGLKKFPFFNNASNWFLPYDPDNTSLNLDPEMKKFIMIMSNSGAIICDSDLYSLALASASMPSIQRDMLKSQFEGQMENLEEIIEKNDSENLKFMDQAIKDVRDLYRFFNLFRKKTGLKNPFEKPFPIIKMPVISDMYKNSDFYRVLGELYFSREFYSEALCLFNAIEDDTSIDSSLWEKKGYCYQSEKDYENALKSYEKSELLKHPGPWLTKKLAFLNRKLGKIEKSKEYYQKALDMEPENISTIMNLGNLMLDSNDISSALQHFYHANYLDPDNIKIIRALAWVELLNGNISKSKDYYGRIVSQDATDSDYLNAGHASLLSGDFKEALNFYRLASENDKNEFIISFLEDLQILKKHGVDTTTALLILDAL